MECIRVYRVNVLCQLSLLGGRCPLDRDKDSHTIHNSYTIARMFIVFPQDKGRKPSNSAGCGRCLFFQEHGRRKRGGMSYSRNRRGGCPLLPFAFLESKRGKLGRDGTGAVYRLAGMGSGWQVETLKSQKLQGIERGEGGERYGSVLFCAKFL